MIPIFKTPFKPEDITPQIAVKYIQRHRNELPRLTRLAAYYDGEQDILSRVKDSNLSNNRLVCNHCKYIADISSSFLLGVPVTYSANHDITALTDALKAVDAPTQDVDLALDGSIYGRCYEMVYMSDDEKPSPKLARLSPLEAFVVYDDTVEQKPVFGVHYFPVYDEYGTLKGYRGMLSTADYLQEIELSTSLDITKAYDPVEHYFGSVTIDEIYNNGQRRGDFETIISLNDAYNILQSDRVNDKEQFVEALLVIKGQVLGDTNEEASETYNALKKFGVMTLDQGSDAAYLTRQFDEDKVEILKKSIEADIHKFSCVPDMSDESFAGNVSGVAMKYKLFALEQKTKIKERYFTEGLRYRLAWLQRYIEITGGGNIPIDDIKIKFTRPLPTNDTEEAQAASQLSGLVSQKTLLSRLSCVEDPEEELKTIKAERVEEDKRALRKQNAIFQIDQNTPIDKGM